MRYRNAGMYNKLFTKILDSSIWMESLPTRIVWLTLLAAMDEHGYAHFASVANLAHRARVTVDEAKAAIDRLEGPDAESADPDHEGRRIERVPGGWMVLNAPKYRELATRLAIQEQTRERVRKHREKRTGNASVTPSNESVTPSEAYTEAKAEAGSEKRARTQAPGALAGTLPRDHMGHAFCGSRFCVSEKVVSDLIRRYGAGGDRAVPAWLQSLNDGLPADKSPNGTLWVLQHFDAWLLQSGRVQPAPTKADMAVQKRAELRARIIAGGKA